MASSFANPFDISIDIFLQESTYDDSDDPDYEPCFVLSEKMPDDIDDMAFEEMEFGLEFETNSIDEEDLDESHNIQGVIKVSTDSHYDELSSDTLYLAFLPQLKMLADITLTK